MIIGVMQNGSLIAADEVAIPISTPPRVGTFAIALPIFPHVQKREVQKQMLSADEKLIISRFTGVSEKAFIGAKGKRDSGESVPFAPIRDVEQPDVDDGRHGGRRAEPVDSIDPAIKREGLEPARLDNGRDGERDFIGEATRHLLAGPGHENEGGAEDVCSGQDCTVDHVRAAHELISRKLSLGEAEIGRHVFRFQR